jgi:hypothetical protein
MEMCLNKQLCYNIKVKSRVCELFVLKKDDFLRLSVNFKDFIEKFLKKSLYKFLKLIEDLNQMKILNNENEEEENIKELDIIEEGSEESFRDSNRKENQSENGYQVKPSIEKNNDKPKNNNWEGNKF